MRLEVLAWTSMHACPVSDKYYHQTPAPRLSRLEVTQSLALMPKNNPGV
jgi:hypothetical protein